MEVKLICSSVGFDGLGIVNYNKKNYKTSLIKDEEGLFDYDLKQDKLTLLKITKESSSRNKNGCLYANECGGCQFMHMDYASELKAKQEYLEFLFKPFNCPKGQIIPMYDPLNYRNKAQMVYKLSKSKHVVCGFYEEKSHRIIPVTDCMLHTKAATKVINELNLILSKNKIKPYEERTREGIIRHVLVRYGFETHELMLVLVTNGEMFPGRNNVVKDLIKADLGITSIVQNYNARDTSIVLGDKERVLYGPGYIYDKVSDYKFKISARSFYQVNSLGMKKLYDKAIELAGITKNDIVIDTYCGVGTISIFASAKAKQVYGIELNKDAVFDAKANARINNIKNIEFICDDATRFMQKLAMNKEHIDIVFMDPPRSGSTEQFINAVGFLKPKKIVYVSCDPTTLKKDLYTFFENEYELKQMEFVDMFPRTSHVESVCLLELKK